MDNKLINMSPEEIYALSEKMGNYEKESLKKAL
jgi:hypothetical protein